MNTTAINNSIIVNSKSIYIQGYQFLSRFFSDFSIILTKDYEKLLVSLRTAIITSKLNKLEQQDSRGLYLTEQDYFSGVCSFSPDLLQEVYWIISLQDFIDFIYRTKSDLLGRVSFKTPYYKGLTIQMQYGYIYSIIGWILYIGWVVQEVQFNELNLITNDYDKFCGACERIHL